jgi:hypothetical protein
VELVLEDKEKGTKSEPVEESEKKSEEKDPVSSLVHDDQRQQLMDMGFSKARADKALLMNKYLNTLEIITKHL